MILITLHATERMTQRGISASDVRAAIKFGRCLPCRQQRRMYIHPNPRQRSLAIIAEQLEERIVVVTAYFLSGEQRTRLVK